jgi:glucose/arabinose dehydrogenase/cytochrome c551/c552
MHHLFSLKHPFPYLLLSLFVFVSCSNEQPDLTAPDESHFSKTMLVTGELFEPIDMTILPNLDILIVQRRGEILRYNHESGELSQAGFLDVFFEADDPDVNAEEGVVGIEKDPDFENNGYVYIFYSPVDTAVNRLSRFVYENDELYMDSETVVLELYSQRNICCHTGGDIAFDSDGLLYLSSGDNSTPFNQPEGEFKLNGYAPLDARPGFEQYDARRSSGNANDLRGKILRIRVHADGSYTIPEGNLYPEGMEGTRPEIYVQGTRNPYAISVDPKTGFLYWGEIGPDAREDSLGTRGPIGYDEINQAREAGHFGWPFFVGNNYAYNEYDYATGTSGRQFDPQNPINDSPNNTGIRELPPAQPAFIWYPYTESEEFPQVGTGGRNAMAGPVYYTDLYPQATRLPDYFDGKLFIYDWIRNWVKVITLSPQGDYVAMEPFMGGTEFNAVIDMETGPDGKLYMLEYGRGWFSANPDAGLARIDYSETPIMPTGDDQVETEADAMTGEVPEAGHLVPTEEMSGEQLVANLDCSSCHLPYEMSVGPPYASIAERYEDTPETVALLSGRIIEGSVGQWSDTRAMPPHAELSGEDAEKIVDWILSFKE